MEIVICRDAVEAGKLGAATIAELVRNKPDAVLGLATGSSPLAIYDELARLYEAGEVSFAKAKGFSLDEYVGLAADHPETYHNVIRRNFVHRVDFEDGNVRGPDGLAEDIPAFCAEYEAAMAAAGGVDLQILGIGTDGHIGFNEPGSSLASRTRIKTLAPKTREDNARFFDSPGEVPMHCITQGIGTILDARRLLLVTQGEGKADAVAAMIEGPVTSMCPASALQLHPDAIAVIDRAAAAGLALTDYYEYVERNRPPGAVRA